MPREMNGVLDPSPSNVCGSIITHHMANGDFVSQIVLILYVGPIPLAQKRFSPSSYPRNFLPRRRDIVRKIRKLRNILTSMVHESE